MYIQIAMFEVYNINKKNEIMKLLLLSRVWGWNSLLTSIKAYHADSILIKIEIMNNNKATTDS